MTGDLTVSAEAQGLVVFLHGSGSSRQGSRNRRVAGTLQKEGFATLLFDLRTPEEREQYANAIDIDSACGRLIEVTNWIQQQEQTQGLPIGYFGASTGAAVALQAAAEQVDMVKAVVSRRGRPDLVAPVLSKVLAPTLFIIGSEDRPTLDLNQQAYDLLRCIKDIHQIEGASHQFEEPGAIEQVAELASDWFKRYLRKDKLHPLQQDQP